jgi:signal transduction histidine kinase
VPSVIGEVVYRVLQESLTNTLRHAGLVDTRIRLEITADAVTVEVSDEGQPRDTDASTVDGHGLAGMRERVQLLGGTLQTGPQPGGGFVVAAEIPLPGHLRADSLLNGPTSPIR